MANKLLERDVLAHAPQQKRYKSLNYRGMNRVNKIKRILIIISIVITCVGCDQATKYVATHSLKNSESYSFANDTFRLQYAENRGAFLGLGSNLTATQRFILFSVLVSLALAVMFLYMVFSSNVNTICLISLSAVLAGGLSNLYDRILNNGAVVDFLNIGIGGLRTGIFNVADMFIMAGLFMLIIESYRKPKASQDDL